MMHWNSLSETITGSDLCDIQVRQHYEQIINSIIFPELEYIVDLSPHITFSNLQARFYQTGRVILYVPLKLSFTLEQMISSIRFAYKTDSPSFLEQITSMEKNPDEIMRIKNIFNGRSF